jgi:AraC-like DNA-binding protein
MSSSVVTIRRYLAESTLHAHDYHQIVLPYVGNLELEAEGRGGLVKQGVGAFIVTGTSHAFLAKGTNGFLVIDLPRTCGSNQLATSLDRQVFFPIDPPVQGLLDYATATLERNPSCAIPEQWASLVIDSLKPGHPVFRSAETNALGRATRFMRSHASRPIRVKDIAAEAGLSATRLHALFRRHYGQSPHAALTQYRVDVARRLLTHTDLPIAEIAVRTGHADQSALTRRLREALGSTPAALRRSRSASQPAPRRRASPTGESE